jgi:hypothetical protein
MLRAVGRLEVPGGPPDGDKRLMSPAPSLAVGFTYYNEGAMLTGAVAGLLAQSGTPDQILVYDDASRDPASHHVPDDSRIVVLRGEVNRGPAVGRKRLLESCSCDYIHFHDSDDYFDPDWAVAIRAMVADWRPDVVLTDSLPVYEQPGNGHVDAGWRVFGGVPPHDLAAFCIANALLQSCVTVSTAFARALGGYPTEIHQTEDYLFSLRLAAAGPRIAFDPRPLTIVRQRVDSRSRTDRVSVFRDACRCLEIVAPMLPERYRGALGRSAFAKGRTLYQLGDREGARSAFALARRFDPTPARFSDQPSHYRAVARALGAIGAERLGELWRGLRVG